MNRTAIVGFVALSWLAMGWNASAQAQHVSLSIHDGRVTLRAENASIRQILAEWERLGQVRVVNADRLAASQPLTLTLEDVSERQALDIILRGVPGYMVVDRTQPIAGASRYDRLVLLARTSTPTQAPAAPVAAGPVPAQPYAQTIDQAPVGQAGPDRAEVEQFEDANAEQPMPTAPVVNPYPAGSAPAVLNSGGAPVGVQPETQFDYANPQRYFDRMRQMQQQQGVATGTPATGTPATGTPAIGTMPGTTAAPYPSTNPDGTPNQSPAATPTAPTTLSKPGIAPVPQPPQQQQPFFNPYNLPPEQLQGSPNAVTPSTTPVEPDRAKYANPYVPPPSTSKPPQ